MEDLPNDFSYKILDDKSDITLEKNQFYVEISNKITEGQIATLAKKLFESKPLQRRFYIFYYLPGMSINNSAWAISHFDPELEIKIIGSTVTEDEQLLEKAKEAIDGEIIGFWKESKITNSIYIIYKKNNDIKLRWILEGSDPVEELLIEENSNQGMRYSFKHGGYNGEYFIFNNEAELELYNKEGKQFATALMLE